MGTDDEPKLDSNLASDLMGEDGFEGVAFRCTGIGDAEGLNWCFEGEPEGQQPYISSNMREGNVDTY
jgi:hypothetical protein